MSIKSNLTRPKTAQTAKSRVVSTNVSISTLMTYQRSLLNVPKYPSELAAMLDGMEQTQGAHPRVKWQNSRDAAHAGRADLRFFAREQRFYDLAFKALTHTAMTLRDAEAARLAFGFGQRSDDRRVATTAGHPVARAAFGLSLHEVITRWAGQTDRDCYAITIIKTEWKTSRAKPVINLAAMSQEVRATLKSIGWEGLLIPEIQGMRSQRKDLLVHFHGIISPGRKRGLPFREAQRHLKAAFPDIGAIKGVDLCRCQEPDDIEHFVMYAAKSPDTIKRLYMDSASPGPEKTREGIKGYSSQFALDILLQRCRLSLTSTLVVRGAEFRQLKTDVLSGMKRGLKSWGVVRRRACSVDFAKVRRRIKRRAWAGRS
jgi:hypothetical protein